MASDALESLGQKVTPGNNVDTSVHPASRPEADRIFNALAGQRAVRDAERGPGMGGDYYGGLRDKFGVLWMGEPRPTAGGDGDNPIGHARSSADADPIERAERASRDSADTVGVCI